MSRPLRCAVLWPVAAPYREPLFGALAAREDLHLRVVYLTRRLEGWDVGDDWFPSVHAYDATVLPARQRARTGRSPVVVPRGVGRELDAFSPDVVVVSEFGPAALLARAWCSRHRRALVHFSELGAAAAQAVPAPQRRLHRVLARRAAAAIGASTQARDRFLALGTDPARTVVSLQSVDAAPIRAAAGAAEARRGEGPLRLLCVARLVADKNLANLIEAVASAGPGAVQLDLVGDGPLRAELVARAKALGALVRFHGSLTPAQTARAYAHADALALVSHHEPFGVALREGAAAGLPLIASMGAGATGDIAVAGRNAIVVDPVDRAGIAAAVRTLAEDPERRTAMAQASREIDAQWPLERSVEAFARAMLLAGGRDRLDEN